MSAWLIAPLFALAPLEEVRIQTPAGVEVSGVLSAIRPETLVVHEGGGVHTQVSLSEIHTVEVNGSPVEIPQLRLEIQEYVESRYGTSDQPRPTPAGVMLASAILPGAGHRMLGDSQTFAAYAVADLVSLGIAAVIIWDRQRFAEGLPLVALSATFRVYSAAEARKEARIRREIHSRSGDSMGNPGF